MNNILIMADEDPLEYENQEFLLKIVNFVFDENKKYNIDCSVVCVLPETIQQYNLQYRKKDYVTDVLSFCYTNDIHLSNDHNNMHNNHKITFQSNQSNIEFPVESTENTYLGDIIVCRQQIYKQAIEFSVKYIEEFSRVIIHGILHLLGFTHDTNDDTEPMLLYQESLLQKFFNSNNGVDIESL